MTYMRPIELPKGQSKSQARELLKKMIEQTRHLLVMCCECTHPAVLPITDMLLEKSALILAPNLEV